MYKIEKHDRITGEVKEFIFDDYESAKMFMFLSFRGKKHDYYNYSIEECIKMGHASFEDSYLLLSPAEFYT